MFDEIYSLITSATRAALRGDTKIRRVFTTALVLLIAAIAVAGVSEANPQTKSYLSPIAAVLGAVAGLFIVALGAYERAQKSVQQEEALQKVEERVREHPDEPQAAWDLARIKLESYINRNLRHVQWIFFLSLTAMITGFVIIGYGVIRVYESPENLKPSIVVACSGLLVEFISTTFLLVYRSTIQQAQTYVAMLEKINAVGMSIQILDRSPSEGSEKVRTQIALQLLTLYGVKASKTVSEETR